MADTPTTFSVLSTDAPNVYIAQRVFQLAERNLVLGQFAEKYQLPQRMSKTLRIVRHKRLALPQIPLTEGAPPDAVSLSIENVDVTVEQWGIVALLTDVVMITTVHPALQKAIDLTGLAMAEVIEREIAKMLLGGTNVIFGGGKTSRANLVATDKLTTSIVLQATAALRARGARDEGGLYHGVIPPQVEADLLAADTTFQNASNYANVRALQFAEIGIWMGVRWARGNFLPIFQAVGAPVSGLGSNTATVAGLAGTTGGAYNTNATLSGGIIIVGRDINSDYERRISLSNTTFALGAGNTALQVKTPTSTNYVYDIYVPSDAAGATAPVLAFSRVAANTTVTVSTLPASTNASPPAGSSTSGVSAFVAWVFGRDAYGRVELDGMSLQSYITPAGASFSNPLAQGRKVGSKIMWKSFIIDNAFFTRLEVGSAFSDNLPA